MKLPQFTPYYCRQSRITMATERTFIMIKPDGVQRGLVGEIIKRFEAKGFKLVAMKLMQVGIIAIKSRFPSPNFNG